MDVGNNDRCQKWEHEWFWDGQNSTRQTILSKRNSIVTFHPMDSSGTAAVRGNRLLLKDRHHYWEVKMMTKPFGTDVMIGVGTNKVDLHSAEFNYCSLLGRDKESWGLSYFGILHHNGEMKTYSTRFTEGNTIGVHLDTWRGTLQYFLDKKPFGVAFTGLRGLELYPMVCSTAAASKMQIIRCVSMPVSLQSECLGILRPIDINYLRTTFPFLQYLSKSAFAGILRKNVDSDDEMTRRNFVFLV